MQYVNLGRSGLKVSRICLGALSFGNPSWQKWVLDEQASRPIIKRAIELGINFFDTANMYSSGESEAVLGRALLDFARREEIVICTKPYHPTGPSVNERGLSRRHLFHAIDYSLRQLKVDYIDLYEIHRLDEAVPMEETLEALHDIVKSGKARYIAASNMLAWQFAKAIYMQDRRGWARFVAIQNQYNLVYREEEREMLPLCGAEGIGLTPHSPLARGFLARQGTAIGAGDTARAADDPAVARFHDNRQDASIRERVQELAARSGTSPAKIALAWLLHQPLVTAPVIGATRSSHVEDAVSALDIKLREDDLTYLQELYQPRRVLLHLGNAP